MARLLFDVTELESFWCSIMQICQLSTKALPILVPFAITLFFENLDYRLHVIVKRSIGTI